MSSFFPVENPDMSPLIMLCMGLLYLVVGVVYVYPIVKGFKLIDHTRKALRAGTNSDFEASADVLHSIMKYCGWLTIISFVLYNIFSPITFIIPYYYSFYLFFSRKYIPYFRTILTTGNTVELLDCPIHGLAYGTRQKSFPNVSSPWLVSLLPILSLQLSVIISQH